MEVRVFRQPLPFPRSLDEHRSLQGKWRWPYYPPKLKQRTALLRKVKDIFRRFDSQPVGRVVQLINLMVRGWVNYFAIGDASRCFGFIKDWVEKRVRPHLMRAQNRRALAGRGGVGAGSMTNSGCSITTELPVRASRRKRSRRNRSHNPCE